MDPVWPYPVKERGNGPATAERKSYFRIGGAGNRPEHPRFEQQDVVAALPQAVRRGLE
jgi:hypothetical protein